MNFKLKVKIINELVMKLNRKELQMELECSDEMCSYSYNKPHQIEVADGVIIKYTGYQIINAEDDAAVICFYYAGNEIGSYEINDIDMD